MAHGNNFIPIGDILMDASQEIGDTDYHQLGRPFYVAAAQRGVGLMMKDTMGDTRTWDSEEITAENLVLQLPNGVEEIDQAYVFTGEHCNISSAPVLREKPDMHRMGGTGYFSHDRWDNGYDPLQRNRWGSPTSDLYFYGRHDGALHLSDNCIGKKVHLVYQGIGVDCLGEDFKIPYWMREAITDYVVLRAASAYKMRNTNFNAMTRIIQEKEAKMERGSWLQAKGFFKRMDNKQRGDFKMYTETFGGSN